MHILHISRTMGQGGAEKVVYQLCIDNCVDEQIVASCGGEYVESLVSHGVPHYIIPDIDSKNPALMIKTFSVLCKLVKTKNIDIIHSHHRMAAFYGRIISDIFNIKHVYTAHNIFFNKVKLTKFSIKKATVVAVGEGVKKNLVDVFGLKGEEITVIKNSVKIEIKNSNLSVLDCLIDKGRTLIGFIGRLCEQKGLDVLLLSFKKLTCEFENLVLVIAGEGEDRNKVEDLVDLLDIRDRVILLGYRDDVFDVILRLSFVVLPSRFEGLPLTPIEVFSQKKTVIATDIPGINEVIKDRENGLLFEKDNVEELTSLMRELTVNLEERQILERNAYKSYVDSYSYDLFIENYLKVYRMTLRCRIVKPQVS